MFKAGVIGASGRYILVSFQKLGRRNPNDVYPKPIGSMYAIYGNIYHQYTPNVSIYTIHGSYGVYPK